MHFLTKLNINKVFSEFTTTLQHVRWKHNRKPIALGTAKSKLFIIPKRPVIPEDEMLEIRRLYNNYRTKMKSINAYLVERHEQLNKIEFDHQQVIRDFEDDFARCSAINEKWNAERKVDREARYERELERELERAQSKIEEKKKLAEQQLQVAEELVRKQKELVATFITPEKLDEAIEYAISNPVDYNFAIDLEGNRIYGRETRVQTNALEIKE